LPGVVSSDAKFVTLEDLIQNIGVGQQTITKSPANTLVAGLFYVGFRQLFLMLAV